MIDQFRLIRCQIKRYKHGYDILKDLKLKIVQLHGITESPNVDGVEKVSFINSNLDRLPNDLNLKDLFLRRLRDSFSENFRIILKKAKNS